VTGSMRYPWVRLSLLRTLVQSHKRKEPVMREKLRFLGLDVHAETIAVAVAEPDGEVRSLGTIPNREDSIRKFIRKLGSSEHLRACYEAGPTGFVLYWQLTQLGVKCDVVAPSLVPTKPGDRVKTDRRDALKLARSHRSDDLTAVWVPDGESEALRDLVRAREAAKQDQLRARHRLTKFLLRTGQHPPLGVKAWTERHAEWLQKVRYTHPAREATLLDCLHEVQHMDQRVRRLEQSIVEVIQLASASMQEVIRGLQALRGIAHISAVTIAVELGNITSRFQSARGLMGYSGAFPSEDSSGKRIRRGGITKSGNAHLRRIVVESAWSYRHRPALGARLRRRQEGLPAEITEVAWKAQNRLHKRYMTLMARGKDQRKTMTAIARELLGFIWAIGIKAEAASKQRIAA
jgi:transposase